MVLLAGFHRFHMWNFAGLKLLAMPHDQHVWKSHQHTVVDKNAQTMLFHDTAPGKNNISEMIELFKNDIPQGKFTNPDNPFIKIDPKCTEGADYHLCFHPSARRRNRSKRRRRRASRRHTRH